MNKSELEHIIRAASAITNQYEIVIVGSQSILGSVESPPMECLESMEADIFALGENSFADLIDGTMGEGSLFHTSFGYYAQGVDSTTSILPSGWENRLTRLQSPNTDGKVGFCLDVTDLFLAKCVANREKDLNFNLSLLQANVVNADTARNRVKLMPLDHSGKERVLNLIERLSKEINSSRSELETHDSANVPKP